MGVSRSWDPRRRIVPTLDPERVDHAHLRAHLEALQQPWTRFLGRHRGTSVLHHDRGGAMTFRVAALMVLGGALASPGGAQLVTGQVQEEGTGAPIASAMVHLLDSVGARAASMPSDGAGRFTLQAPEVGTYRIEAVRPGYVSAESAPFAVPEGGVAVVPTLRLMADEEAIENLPVPGRTITGRVVAEGFEEPLTSVLVRALDEGYDPVAATMTDAAGRFRLEVPEAGVYRVEAVRTGFETRRVEGIGVGENRGGRLTLGLEYASIQPAEDYYRNQTNLTRGRAQFTERREQGFGFHFDRAAIAALGVERPAEIFATVPGLMIDWMPFDPIVQSTHGWRCFRVYYNHFLGAMQGSSLPGHRLRPAGLEELGARGPSTSRRRPRLLDHIDPDEIEGIEIYRSYREIPDDLRYSLLGHQLWGPDELGGCGIAIVWTSLGW
jgi:hypothetical protein